MNTIENSIESSPGPNRLLDALFRILPAVLIACCASGYLAADYSYTPRDIERAFRWVSVLALAAVVTYSLRDHFRYRKESLQWAIHSRCVLILLVPAITITALRFWYPTESFAGAPNVAFHRVINGAASVPTFLLVLVGCVVAKSSAIARNSVAFWVSLTVTVVTFFSVRYSLYAIIWSLLCSG